MPGLLRKDAKCLVCGQRIYATTKMHPAGTAEDQRVLIEFAHDDDLPDCRTRITLEQVKRLEEQHLI